MNVSFEEAVKRGWVMAADVPKTAQPTKARKAELEGEEQAQLIKQFRQLYPVVGHLLVHIPNGGSRKNAFEGWRLKEQGVRAGVSDLHLPVARGGFFGLWIEFKAAAPNAAPVSESQEKWLMLMAEQGYRAVVCRGVAEAMKVLVEYLGMPATKVVKPRPKSSDTKEQ